MTVVGLLAVLMVMVALLVSYVSGQRQRAIGHTRAQSRESCAQSGLQLARSYFGRNFASWNSYLSDPRYDALAVGFSRAPEDLAALRNQLPHLFADLDGNGESDVLLFVRDNQDEFPPAVPNPGRDNDQNVIVGAVCISTTLVPKLADGSPPPEPLLAQALLSFNVVGSTYASQSSAGAVGSGNLNAAPGP